MQVTAYIQRGDIGVDVDIYVTERNTSGTLVPTDLTNATQIKYRFRDTNGTVTELTGSVHNAPTEGVLRCTTDASVFTVDGEWEVFAVVTMTGGKKFNTPVQTYGVGRNY